MLDRNSKTFIVYISVLNTIQSVGRIVYSFRAFQIDEINLCCKKQPNQLYCNRTKPLQKFYWNILIKAGTCFSDFVIELYMNTSINQYAIKLIEDKQIFYIQIYALSLVELEILKTCIETFLKPEFIQSFKSSTGALISF